MRGTMINCIRCDRLFRQEERRDLCPACFGQKVFGRAPQPTPRAMDLLREPVLAVRRDWQSPEHALRTELRARQALAHTPGVRRGQTSHWAPRA